MSCTPADPNLSPTAKALLQEAHEILHGPVGYPIAAADAFTNSRKASLSARKIERAGGDAMSLAFILLEAAA